MALCKQPQVVQNHKQYPSRSALTNPTPPPMSWLQRTNKSYTTTNAFALTFLSNANPPKILDTKAFSKNYKFSNTTNKILAAAH